MNTVAVLRGGPSDEYAVSMLTGQAVLGALKELELPHRDIVITKKGEWLEDGFVKEPADILRAVDVAFIALHGGYGEDGQVQRVLQRLNVPFTGSKALASAIAFNKHLTKETLREHGILMPRHRRINRSELADIDTEIPNIFSEIGDELFLKPIASGSSVGASYSPTATTFKANLTELFDSYDEVMVEQFIRGKEATVGVLENFRSSDLYTLPVVEIVPPNGEPMFSHVEKYSGNTEEIVPGRFSYEEKSLLNEAATIIHKALDCKHYSRSDFIVRDGRVYFLEVNTLPGLTKESLFPKAAAAIGLEFPQLVSHLVKTASM